MIFYSEDQTVAQNYEPFRDEKIQTLRCKIIYGDLKAALAVAPSWSKSERG